MFARPEAPSNASNSTNQPPVHSLMTACKTTPSTHPRVMHSTTYNTTLTDSTTSLPTHKTWQSHENFATTVPLVKQATFDYPCHADRESYPEPAHHTQFDPVENVAHLNPQEREQASSSHNLIQLIPVQVGLKPNSCSTVISPSLHHANPEHVPNTSLSVPRIPTQNTEIPYLPHSLLSTPHPQTPLIPSQP